MKKIIIIAAVLALASCIDGKLSSGGPKEFYAVSAGQQVSTRTSMASPNASSDKTNPAGLVVNWNAGDAVAVYDTRIHEFTAASTGTKVKIKGEISEDFSGTYYAMYPFASCFGFESGVFSSMIPQNQYLEDGGHWDPRAAVVAGSCAYDQGTIEFHNANALVALYLPAAASSVTIRVYGDEMISGDMSVNVSGSTMSITKQTSAYNVSTLNGSMEADTPYYMALLPAAAQHGFSLYVNYTEPFSAGGNSYSAGEYHYRNESNSTIFNRERILILDMTEVPPEYLGEPLNVKPHFGNGAFLFRSEEGSVSMVKGGGGADKLEWMQTKIFDYAKNGPLDLQTDLLGYQLNQNGWHQPSALTPDDDGKPRYYMQLAGTGIYNDAYLKYDPVLQGFYMVSNRDDATIVYVYAI